MTDAETIRYYADLLMKHGATFRAGDWGSPASQHTRFGVLTEDFIQSDCACSFLDVGCGIGDMSGHVLGTQWGHTYEGWDVAESLVAAAQARHCADRRHPTFLVRDLLTSTETRAFDYVLASGLFTHRDAVWMCKAIARMWDLCRVAVAFNCLSTWGDSQPGEFRADPVWTLAWCRQQFTPYLKLDHSYLGHDFTLVLLRKDKP